MEDLLCSEGAFGDEGRDVSALMSEALRIYCTRTAISDNGKVHTNAQLGKHINRIAGALLAVGCQPRTKVCLAVQHGVALCCLTPRLTMGLEPLELSIMRW